MGTIESGLNWKGEPCKFYMERTLLENVEPVKKVVLNKDFDFVSVIAGLPGMGKSNFSMSLAKFFDPNFCLENVAFTADQFIEKTNELPKNSSIVLDESFDSMNSKVGMSREFLKVMNHLQLIRQRNLFIILNLPNFFDLHKSIAIYRSSFLFVVYGQSFGERGTFAAYGREEKKMLYINGSKYMNYHCEPPNFRGRFFKQTAIDQKEYEVLKLEHLRQQVNEGVTYSSVQEHRDKIIAYNKLIMNMPVDKIQEITGLSNKSVYNSINRQKKYILEKYK